MQQLIQTGKFVAKESDGTEHTIRIIEETHTITTMHSASIVWSTPRPHHLETTSGHRVNSVARGQYELLRNDQLIPLTSSDPAAP